MIIKQPASDTTIEAGGDNRDHIFFLAGKMRGSVIFASAYLAIIRWLWIC